MANTTLTDKCFELSAQISALGVGINSNRAAQQTFSMLTEACADIGGGIRAINLLPARSMRINQTEELIRLSAKVIFLLESGIRQGMFPAKQANSALSAAAEISNGLGVYVEEYCAKPVPVAVPVQHAQQVQPVQSVQAGPEGFTADNGLK